LVEANGVLEWVRLRELKVGMKIVCVSSAKSLGMQCKGVDTTTINQGEKAHGFEAMFMGSGLDQSAWLKAAMKLSDAKDTATCITRKIKESLASNFQVRIQIATANQESSIDTESPLSSLMRCLQSKEAYAASARSQLLQNATSGERIFALTTATRLELSGVSSATSAIWLPDTLERHLGPVSLLNTSEFMSERIIAIEATGFEEVFDMEVEHTGNFIANGMVTHNTRWHEDDLIGRILKNRGKYGLRVRSVTLPALKEDDGKKDPIGRQPGEALWPERWPVEVLERRKKISSIWWSALYQGRPAAEGTNEFPEEYFKNIWLNDDEWPERYPLLSASYLDPSKAKNDKRDDYQALVYVGYHNGHILVESDIDRIPVTKMLRKWVQWDRERRPKISGCEGNAFQELLIGEYNDVCKEEGYNHDRPECITNSISKVVRIRRVGPWLSRGLLKFKRTRSNELLIEQLKEFPNGGKDDGPDALDGALRLLLKLLGKDFEESVTETPA
jgi:predicted phage terminase large subunit-like protein